MACLCVCHVCHVCVCYISPGTEPIHNLQPKAVHQRVPTFLGSPSDVDALIKCVCFMCVCLLKCVCF